MSDVFSRLTQLSEQLNATSDSITEALKRIEAKLAALRLGVAVWLDTPLKTDRLTDRDTGDPNETVTTRLGYTKIKGTWHLAIINDLHFVTTGDDTNDEPQALLQANREDRIEALKRMPELIEAIEARAKKELHKLESALALAKDL
jgi:hypothetical protein